MRWNVLNYPCCNVITTTKFRSQIHMWAQNLVQIHQTLLPRGGVGSGYETRFKVHIPRTSNRIYIPRTRYIHIESTYTIHEISPGCYSRYWDYSPLCNNAVRKSESPLFGCSFVQ